MLAKFQASPFSPPSVKECIKTLGEDVYYSMLDGGEFIQIDAETVFQQEAYDQMKAEVIRLLDRDKEISVASVRDHLQTSRKYVLAILEHFDELKITRRVGDIRVKY